MSDRFRPKADVLKAGFTAEKRTFETAALDTRLQQLLVAVREDVIVVVLVCANVAKAAIRPRGAAFVLHYGRHAVPSEATGRAVIGRATRANREYRQRVGGGAIKAESSELRCGGVR